MKPTGRMIQVQELIGRPYVMAGKRPPYGELYVDDTGKAIACVVHTKTAVVEVPGLTIAAIKDGPGGTKELTYVISSPDPRPAVRPGQGVILS